MNHLLTIGLPTYNRADLLDGQLAWLSRAIKNISEQVEIVISDNCSSDHTSGIIEKWRLSFGQAKLLINRNSENIGAIRNIAYCIQSATAPHVWVISDDDPIEDKALSKVFSTLSANPELALMVLNFSSKNFKTGEVVSEKCFSLKGDRIYEKGHLLFEKCLIESYGGVTLTTALIYRTDLAQQSLLTWPGCLDNLSVQTYITGYSAFHGSATVTEDVYLTCSLGDHFFFTNPELLSQLDYQDKPEMYKKLADIGYKSILRKKFLYTLINKARQGVTNPQELLMFGRKVWGLMATGQ